MTTWWIVAIVWFLSLCFAYSLGFATGVRLLSARLRTQMSNDQLLLDLDRLEAGQASVSATNGGKR